MATLVLTDAYVLINAVDLSDHVTQVSLDYDAESLDDTHMAQTTHSHKGGLKDWTMQIDFQQDFAAAKVDATLFPLVGTTFTVEVRPTSAARSATNPGYTGTGLLTSYPPLGNSVGELAMTSAEIVAAGTLSRATA